MNVELTIKNVGEDLDFIGPATKTGSFNKALMDATWQGSIEDTWLEEGIDSIDEYINNYPEVRIDLDEFGNTFFSGDVNSTNSFILPIASNVSIGDDSGSGAVRAVSTGTGNYIGSIWYGLYSVEGSGIYYGGSIVIGLDNNGEILQALFTDAFPGSDSGSEEK